PPHASATTNTSNPSSRADSVGNDTQASVRNPATINRFRPVAMTAFLAASSSQTFIFFRSIAVTEGRASCSAGSSGPLYTRVADVETTTGTLNATAVRANATALLSRTCRDADSTPNPRPA